MILIFVLNALSILAEKYKKNGKIKTKTKMKRETKDDKKTFNIAYSVIKGDTYVEVR